MDTKKAIRYLLIAALLGTIFPFVEYLLIIQLWYMLIPMVAFLIFCLLYLAYGIIEKNFNHVKNSLYLVSIILMFVFVQLGTYLATEGIQKYRSKLIIKQIEEYVDLNGHYPEEYPVCLGIYYVPDCCIKYKNGPWREVKYYFNNKQWQGPQWYN